MRFPSASVRVFLGSRAANFPRMRWLTRRGLVALRLLREVGAWTWRQLSNRWLLTGLMAVTLGAATLSCLVGPEHPFHLIPCYWEGVELPGRLVRAALHALAQSIVRTVAELIK